MKGKEVIGILMVIAIIESLVMLVVADTKVTSPPITKTSQSMEKSSVVPSIVTSDQAHKLGKSVPQCLRACEQQCRGSVDPFCFETCMSRCIMMSGSFNMPFGSIFHHIGDANEVEGKNN